MGCKCNCTIEAGDNVTVTGSGSSADPFVVSSEAGGAGSVLGEASDNDATIQVVTTTTTAFAAVDVVRLEPVTFTVPASGRVNIEQSGSAQASVVSTGTWLQWGVLESGVVVPASIFAPVVASITGSEITIGISRTVGVSGLTPGASLTWTWAHARATGDGLARTIWGGTGTGAIGEARIRILAA